MSAGWLRLPPSHLTLHIVTINHNLTLRKGFLGQFLILLEIALPCFVSAALDGAHISMATCAFGRRRNYRTSAPTSR